MRYIAPLILSFSIALSAHAAVPADSDYKKDTQSTYNKDATNDIFNFANTIACYIKSMAPEQMIRRGTEPYLARIDANKCEDSEQNSSSTGGAAAAPRFQDAWVIPGIDAEGALTAKVYISGAGYDGQTEYIQVVAKIRNGVTEAPPNGQWRVDFCSSTTEPSPSGLAPCDYGLGFADIDTSKLTIFGKDSRNSNGYNSGLINYSATKTGTGFTRSQNSNNSNIQDIRVAFNPERYLVASRLNSGAEVPVCFDPSRENPNTLFSVWSNYFYDVNTGQKINNGNQGFLIGTESRPRNSGFVSYNGVNFWDDVPLADQQPGKKVTGNNKTYTIGVANGYLEKIVQNTTTLSEMDGTTFKFSFGGNSVNGRNPTANVFFEITRRENGAGRVLNGQEWVSFVGNWNNQTASFDINGYQICGQNCAVTPLSSIQSFRLLDLIGSSYLVDSFGGWQDGTGINYWGRLTNSNGSAVNSSAPISREITRRVSPSDPSLGRLTCVDWNCPYLDGSNIQQTSQANSYPFQAADIKTFQWNSSTGEPNYVRGDNLGQGGAVITSPVYAFYDANTTENKSIRLFPTDKLSQLQCIRNNVSGYCNDPRDAGYTGEYYRWNTGGRWTRNVYLKDDSNNGQIVSFDPPISFTYTVPTNPPIGVDRRYAGKKILLQSPGQGQIWFPSHCISLATGNTIDCSSNDPSKEWVTDVYIPTVEGPDGMVTLLDSNGNESSTKYLVKWSNRGAVLAKASSCPDLTLPVNQESALPTIAGWQDPTNPSSPNYLGTTWINVPSGTLPKVIHGVVQP